MSPADRRGGCVSQPSHVRRPRRPPPPGSQGTGQPGAFQQVGAQEPGGSGVTSHDTTGPTNANTSTVRVAAVNVQARPARLSDEVVGTLVTQGATAVLWVRPFRASAADPDRSPSKG